MEPSERLRTRLLDILLSIERVQAVVRDLRWEAFEASFEKQWLVERGVEIISEASRHIPSEITSAYPAVPWADIRGIGNRLQHEYERIDHYLMWTIATSHLSDLRPVIAELLDKIERDTSP